ncbi:MAG: hypothetical protein DBX55_08125 [Verrucomicrobia bacterium]|nr:MAG: hypothetical protein DBX55_08125 [Verrucomicrobiota bacterium]
MRANFSGVDCIFLLSGTRLDFCNEGGLALLSCAYIDNVCGIGEVCILICARGVRFGNAGRILIVVRNIGRSAEHVACSQAKEFALYRVGRAGRARRVGHCGVRKMQVWITIRNLAFRFRANRAMCAREVWQLLGFALTRIAGAPESCGFRRSNAGNGARGISHLRREWGAERFNQDSNFTARSRVSAK